MGTISFLSKFIMQEPAFLLDLMSTLLSLPVANRWKLDWECIPWNNNHFLPMGLSDPGGVWKDRLRDNELWGCEWQPGKLGWLSTAQISVCRGQPG